MSYYVEYNPELKSQYPSITKREKKLPVKGILLLLLVAVAGYMLLSSGVLQFFVPGDPEVTTTAFSDLVERVGTGEPVREAVRTFFQEVIVNGA